MTTEDSQKYEEWLTTIVNTRFIYNTMDELENVMDNKSIHSNGVKRCYSTPQKLRSAFRDLKVEVELKTNGMINLERLLIHYKRAWHFFRNNLWRRSNPTQVALELLRYCYPPFSSEGLGNKKKYIFERIIDENINIPFLVLMLLKAVPGYDSKDGDIVGMLHKYEEIMELMEQFTKGCSFFSILPSITQARDEKNKSRLMLLYHVSRILDTYESYVGKDNLYSTVSGIKETYVNLDIEGFWNESEGKLIYTDFWQIEAASNDGAYFATHWHKDADNKLTGIRYSMFLVEGIDGSLVAYILHPEAIKHRMKGLQYGDSDQVWYSTDMPMDKHPVALPFKRYMLSSVWPLTLNLTRVSEESTINTYNNWFKMCEIFKPYKRFEYTFTPGIYAVTASHIYISSDKDGEYFKIPRAASEGFDQIQLGDNVGLMHINNRTYLVFDELLLFILITEKGLDKYQIKRVNYIE